MVGEKITKYFDVLEENIKIFSLISKDVNPIHIDEDFASKTFFKKRIAHGMYVGSFISAVIANDLPGVGSIYLHQSMDFKNPVFINDKIAVTVEVVSQIKPTIYELRTVCTNQDAVIVIEGKAIVKYSV
jgi:3-hydroxybutyryl-CoA dehydratase